MCILRGLCRFYPFWSLSPSGKKLDVLGKLDFSSFPRSAFRSISMFSTATHCRKSSTLALCKHSEVSDKSGMQTCGRSNHLSCCQHCSRHTIYFTVTVTISARRLLDIVGWVVYSIDRYSIECKLQTHSTLDIPRSLFLLELKRKDLDFGTL